MTDFNTNNSPDPGSATVSVVKSGGQAALTPGDGRLYPFAGLITPHLSTDPFASYIRPAEQIFASVTVLREPNYDVRFFSVELSGWLAGEKEMDSIINALSE